uniref:Beta-1,4-galactosyltransferase 4 n=1 Tax=Suricata suricatta TaxID=37032 RepID=A0A673SPH3_SURSU
MANFNKVLVWGQGEALTEEASVREADLHTCPAVSPYLRGQNKLVFKPDLTLEEVEEIRLLNVS